MTLFRGIRVKVESSTSGTGTFTLGAAVSSAFQDFDTGGVVDGDYVHYVAFTDTQFEAGSGVYSSGTLTRDEVDASSDGSPPLTPVDFATNPTISVSFLPRTLDGWIGGLVVSSTAPVVSSTTPGAPAIGDQWLDTDDKIIREYSPVTWDIDSSVNITLSNGDLTATGNVNDHRNIRAIVPITGKQLFAIIPVFPASVNLTRIGVSTPNETIWQLGDTNESCAYRTSGIFSINDVDLVSGLDVILTGDTVYVAVDPDARLIWYKVNAGDWNSSPTADPATGTEGLDISDIEGQLYPAVSLRNNHQATIDPDPAISVTGFTTVGDNYWSHVVALSAVGMVNIKDFGAKGDGVTDDAPAFQAFTEAFQGTIDEDDGRITAPGIPVELYIPPGRYFVTPGDNGIGHGIPRLKVHAYGVEWLSNLTQPSGDMTTWGSGGHYPNAAGATSAKFETSSFQATSVTLVTTADHEKFRADDWVQLTNLDIQGYGYPVNAYNFEFIQIDTVNTGTGVITFKTNIQKRYFDHFPQMDDGTLGTFNDQGGPATMFCMQPGWDMDLEIIGMRNLSISPGTPHAVLTRFPRKVKFTDCVFDDGEIASTGQNTIFERCTFPEGIGRLEMDKCVTSLVFRDCEIPAGVILQSASVENFTLDNCNCILEGAARNNRIINSRVLSWKIGAWYGPTETTYIENSFIGNIFFNYADGVNITDIADFTYSNGTLTYVMDPGNNTMPGWAVPGAVVMPVSPGDEFWFPPFLVLDVRQSGSNMLIDTTLDAMPSSPYSIGTSGIDLPDSFMSHPCPSMTVISGGGNFSTGAMRDAEADPIKGRPFATYARRIFTGNRPPFSGKVRGYVVRVTFNVIRAYSGVASNLTWSFGGDYIDGTTSAVDEWPCTLDAETIGLRTIIPGSSTNLGTDSIPVLPASGAWFGNDLLHSMELSADITAEAPNKWPIMEVTVETNQGYAEVRTVNVLDNLVW